VDDARISHSGQSPRAFPAGVLAIGLLAVAVLLNIAGANLLFWGLNCMLSFAETQWKFGFILVSLGRALQVLGFAVITLFPIYWSRDWIEREHPLVFKILRLPYAAMVELPSWFTRKTLGEPESRHMFSLLSMIFSPLGMLLWFLGISIGIVVSVVSDGGGAQIAQLRSGMLAARGDPFGWEYANTIIAILSISLGSLFAAKFLLGRGLALQAAAFFVSMLMIAGVYAIAMADLFVPGASTWRAFETVSLVGLNPQARAYLFQPSPFADAQNFYGLSGSDDVFRLWLFFVQRALDAISMGVGDAMGWSVSGVRHNTSDLLVSALVASYQVVVGILVAPLAVSLFERALGTSTRLTRTGRW
jgi:hypothetical protein